MVVSPTRKYWFSFTRQVFRITFSFKSPRTETSWSLHLEVRHTNHGQWLLFCSAAKSWCPRIASRPGKKRSNTGNGIKMAMETDANAIFAGWLSADLVLSLSVCKNMNRIWIGWMDLRGLTQLYHTLQTAYILSCWLDAWFPCHACRPLPGRNVGLMKACWKTVKTKSPRTSKKQKKIKEALTMPNYHQHQSTYINNHQPTIKWSTSDLQNLLRNTRSFRFLAPIPDHSFRHCQRLSAAVGGAYRCMVHRGSAAPCIGQETPGDQKVGLLGQKKTTIWR